MKIVPSKVAFILFLSMLSCGSDADHREQRGQGGRKNASRVTKKSTKAPSTSTKGPSKATKASSKATASPTPGPAIVFEPTTTAPTGENSIPVRAEPYALLYTLENDMHVPSAQDFGQVEILTTGYLEVFFIAEFAQTSLIDLDDFLTTLIRTSFTIEEPVQIDYRSTGLFNPSSIFLPTVRELNTLIQSAFAGDNLAEYINLLGSLPATNPFSSTLDVVLGAPDAMVP